MKYTITNLTSYPGSGEIKAMIALREQEVAWAPSAATRIVEKIAEAPIQPHFFEAAGWPPVTINTIAAMVAMAWSQRYR